jgi:hypothetical protein
LALFRGGFTREAAEHIAQARLPQLASLVQKSLLQRVGERYRMHELIRQYALEQLPGLADSEQTIDRFVTYYRSFALQAAAASLENYQISMLEGLASELDNLYAALSLAYHRQLGDSAANLCQGMRVYWVTHGLLDEGIRWVQQFLSLPNLIPLARGILLSAQIPLLRLSGAWERTLQTVEEALPILPPDSDDAAAAYYCPCPLWPWCRGSIRTTPAS